MSSEFDSEEFIELVEVQALPLMVDCRAGAGAGAGSGGAAAAAAHDVHAPNGAQPPLNIDNHHNQTGGSGDMGHGVTPPAARASTPANTTTLSTYTTGGMNMGAQFPAPGGGGGGAGGCGAGYVCGVKSVVWCAPHSPPAPAPAPHAPPPPPPPVNPHVFKSVQANGADLPMNDIPTLRFYFNLGVECMWAAYGPPPPPRHYSPRDIAQDMQQMSLHDRNVNHSGDHKHKPADNKQPINNQGKNNGQRPLLGPRFNKRGGNQEGNNHNQNKGHNNMGNKGPNNRRNSHNERPNNAAGAQGYNQPPAEECVMEPPLLTLPYIPYPPPLYPIPYYPVDDPAMMGMMGGMGYVGYEEGVEYPPLQPYYPPPPPHYPPPHHPHHPDHHK